MPTQDKVIYCRTSRPSAQDLPLSRQIDRCRSYAESIGFRPEGFLLIVDRPSRGTDLNRPGYQKLRRLAEIGQLRTLILTDLSRIGRGSEVNELISKIIELGGKLFAVDSKIISVD